MMPQAILAPDKTVDIQCGTDAVRNAPQARGIPDLQIPRASTPQEAIRKRCLNCVEGYKDVERCDSGPDIGERACPLWQFRMGHIRKAGGGSRMKAIRAYCKWCMNGNAAEIRGCTIVDCSLWAYRFGKRLRKETAVT